MHAARLAVMILAAPSMARALPSFDPGDLSGIRAEDVDALLEQAGIGTLHRPMVPASPLGTALGIELGAAVSGIASSDSFERAMRAAGVTASIPAYLPLPRLLARKGLPFGIDLGASFVKYQDNQVIGGDVQWTASGGKGRGPGPALAARLSYTHTKLFFMRSRGWQLDAVVSAPDALLVEPYVGAGLQKLSGFLDVAVGGATGFPASLSREVDKTTGHLFIGVPFRLALARLTAEYDYSFAGVSVLGAKLSLDF